jgi:deoxyribose-phosphate aldolase
MKDFESEHGLTHKSMRALKAGAARVGLHADSMTPADVASIIDHTLLKADATRDDVERLCGEAREYGFATVCVNPAWVATASRAVRDSGVGVCAVVGFPLGATPADVKQYETRRAISDGATEIDMMINVGALKSDGTSVVEAEVAGVVGVCRDSGVLIKVIIEAALLTEEEKAAACRLAKDAGADYVKTSTGFGPGGATVADVALMRRVAGPDIGVKAAGGVRDYEAVKALVVAGATRIGTSAGVKILAEAQAGKSGALPPAGS